MNIYLVVHQDNIDQTTHHKAFDSLQLAESYEKQLEMTGEAKWVETRKFYLLSEEDIILTPRQEELYWESIYNETRKEI